MKKSELKEMVSKKLRIREAAVKSFPNVPDEHRDIVLRALNKEIAGKDTIDQQVSLPESSNDILSNLLGSYLSVIVTDIRPNGEGDGAGQWAGKHWYSYRISGEIRSLGGAVEWYHMDAFRIGEVIIIPEDNEYEVKINNLQLNGTL